MGLGVGIIALFATPLSNVLMTLFAQDPFTFLFASLAVLFESPFMGLVAGFGLAISHLEVGVFTIAILLALRAVDTTRRTSWTASVPGLAGLVGGAVGVELYVAHAGAGLEARGSYISLVGPARLFKSFLYELPTWLYTTMSAFWVFVASLWTRLPDRRVRRVLFLAFGAATVATMFTNDETRVFALLMWPVTLWFALYSTRAFSTPLVRRVTALTFVAAVLLPRLAVAGGHVWGSNFAYLLDRLF